MDRFAFGANWSNFVQDLDDARILKAKQSICEMLELESLFGKRFLDIGSGSGLFSLAARSIGASVWSFDFDQQSVACTSALRQRYFQEDADWVVEQGSVLDKTYLAKLGKFDIVYSWGVLHHTGAMWLALENAIGCVREEGRLFIAIYNDQGVKSRVWWLIKWLYNKLPNPINFGYAYLLSGITHMLNIMLYSIRLQPMTAIQPLLDYRQKRGMKISNDIIDWMGGFPYEFASYEVLTQYMNARGFALIKGRKATSLGCHQMVFSKIHQ